jgi:hypothetical protein
MSLFALPSHEIFSLIKAFKLIKMLLVNLNTSLSLPLSAESIKSGGEWREKARSSQKLNSPAAAFIVQLTSFEPAAEKN